MAKKAFNTQGIDKFFSEAENAPEAINIHSSHERSDIVRKTYYVRADQHKALKLRALNEDTDISSLIQKALDDFFAK